MTAQIACSNQKGGAGKTTTAINVAGALNRLGHDVLLVDIDPQGHATEGLGFEDKYLKEITSLFDVLPDFERHEEINDLVCEHPEMDVIPSHQNMINAEDALSGVMKREERLGMALDQLGTDYDVVMIDCPPNLGVLTDNAIVSARNVLIPAQAKSTSIRALEILFRQLKGMEPAFGEIRELGLVANEVGTDGEAEEMMEWFDDVFDGRAPVWEVRKRVALQRAWNAGVSIFEHDEECDMEAVYLDVARSLEKAL